MSLNLVTPVAANELVRGNWRNIRWMPNTSTGEVLNIGVVFNTVSGDTHVRMLDYFERVKCLYSGKLARDAKFLTDVTREALLARVDPPVANVILSESKFASGLSVDEVLSALFTATVPLGSPREMQATSAREPTVVETTQTVRQFVLDELKRISGERASRIISSERVMQVNDGSRTYHIDIPLQTASALGTIVSARSSRIGDAELTLHRADTDLQIARQVYKRDSLFMYVVRPSIGTNLEKVDALLDEFTFKFKRMGVQMKTYADPELVAPDIVEDMPVYS
jgi:hypothetical protein